MFEGCPTVGKQTQVRSFWLSKGISLKTKIFPVISTRLLTEEILQH